MSVEVAHKVEITVTETLETNPDSSTASNRQVIHNQFNTSESLNAGSTPPATKVAAFKQALTAGAATIDLTSLLGANGASVDGSGLKVQLLKMKNLGANVMSIVPGASNGYDILGSDFKATLSQNQEITLYGNDATPDIGGTDKTLDLAGTSAQEAEIIIVMG